NNNNNNKESKNKTKQNKTCSVGTVRQVKQQETASGGTITTLEIQLQIGLPHRSGNELVMHSCSFEPEHFCNFAPPGTQTSKVFPTIPKWRKELVQGSQCDCLDSVNKWYTCHVVAVDDFNSIKLNYDEWQSKYDEWISRDNVRIQKHKTQAKGGRTSGGAPGDVRNLTKVDDEDDPLDEDIFSIYRGELGDVSFHLVEALNEFGRAGGFDLLLRRLDNHKPNMPVKNMRSILSALSKSVKSLTGRAYRKFILPLHDRVWTTLESMTDIELRDLKKELLSRIVECMEDLLLREKSIAEVAQITETFQLTMALRRLTSQTIERRVNGVQHIASVCAHTRKGSPSHSAKFITAEFLSKWIEENKLLDIIFGPKSHPQLMKQGTEILKFICMESTLTIDHLSIIWNALERAAKKSDDVENELQTVCKILEDIAYYFTPEHFEFLFSKLENMSLKELREHHLQLMKGLTRPTHQQNASGPAGKVIKILWKLVQDESSVDDKLVNEAKNLMKEVLTTYFARELREPLLKRCIDNLVEHKSVIISLQVLEKVLQIYATPSSSPMPPMMDDLHRWEIIAKLNTQYAMMKHFFADIEFFKEKASAKAKEIRTAYNEKELSAKYFAAVNQMKSVGSPRFSYLDEVKERLDFLDFILGFSNLRLEKQEIDIIWNSMVVNCLTPDEREEAFKWFQKMMTGLRFRSLGDDLPQHLFINKFLTDIPPGSITLPAYESFEKFFLFVNQRKGNIEVIEHEKTFYVTNFDELIGIDYLWLIVLNTHQETVSQKSISFLNSVCNRLGIDLRPQVGRIRKSILDRAMKELAQTIDTHKKTPTTETRNQCIRVLDLIHQFLNATESRGLGGHRPHNALSRGKKLFINIIDEISPGRNARPSRFRVTIHENDTLWELRCTVASKLHRAPEMVQLSGESKLDEDKNSNTVASLNIRDGCYLRATLKEDKSQRVPLVTSTAPKKLVERAKAAFQHIFKQFAKNQDGTMSQKDMRDYILACGAGAASASKSRIRIIFNQFGEAENLDADGFVNFYQLASIERADHVWKDLYVFGYGQDLRLVDVVRKEEEELLARNPERLPRYMLAHEDKYFNLLFNDCLNLGDPLILSAAWRLVLRLPTNDKLRKNVSTLETIEKETDWAKLLPTDDLFRLVYSLLICESFSMTPETPESDNVLKEKVEWRKKFLEKKGFSHLIKVLKSIDYEKNSNSSDTSTSSQKADIDVVTKNTRKLAIASLLRMVHLFFLSAIDCIPGMEAVVEQIGDASFDAETEEEKKKNESKTEGIFKKNPNLGIDPGASESNLDSEEWGDFSPLDGNYFGDDIMAEQGDNDENENNFVSQLEKKLEDDVSKVSPMPKDLFTAYLSSAKEETNASKVILTETNPQQSADGAKKLEEKEDKDEKVADVTSSDKDKSEQPKVPETEATKETDKGKETTEESKEASRTVTQTSIRFNELVRSTMKDFSDDLIKSLNFDELLLQLLNILKLASMDSQVTQERDWVVRYAVRLWISILLLQPSLLPQLFEKLEKDPSILLDALHSKDKEIGSEFAGSLRKLCRIVDESPRYTPELKKKLPGVEVTRFFLHKILLKHLPEGGTDEIDPEQHFYLLISLMQEYTEKYKSPVSEFNDLFKDLIKQLKAHKSREVFGNPANDKVLTGAMSLLSVLLSGDKSFREQAGESGLVEEIFKYFLFATGKTDEEKENNWPKCKTNVNRKLGFRLLVQLCMEVPQNFGHLEKLIQTLHKEVRPPISYGYSPDQNTRSNRGYVGLENLGSTCYMNSLLQQFYMMPHFRNAIICSGKEKAKDMTPEQQADSALYQVMRTFSFLTLSERQAFNTREFCRSYKDETVCILYTDQSLAIFFYNFFFFFFLPFKILQGRPIDVRVQQDVQEFFNILTDRIENELKGTKFRYLLQDCFGGKVVNQMICQGGCGSVRERQQDFVMISLPIKNRTNMKESLDAYVQPEQLEDVQCEACNKKCTTLKREVLYKLGNSVIVHLKRFELNFETFRHEKSNQRFEFPEELDLEQYTKEGLDRLEKVKIAESNPNVEVPQQYSVHSPEYYKFRLTGVTVHTGSADAGHYYSFIKDRKTGEWNEFNDTLIKPLDPKDLDKECFGGKTQKNNAAGDAKADDNKEESKDQDKNNKTTNNGDKRAADANVDGPNAGQEHFDDSMVSLQNKGQEEKKEEEFVNVLDLLDTDPGRIMAQEIKNEIVKNNIEFMRHRQIFNLLYFNFLFDLIRVAPITPCKEYGPTDEKNPDLPLIKLASRICFQYIARTADSQSVLDKFVAYLKWLFDSFVISFVIGMREREGRRRIGGEKKNCHLSISLDNIPACKWLLLLLTKKREYLFSYLLETRDTAVTRACGGLLVHIFKVLKPFEEEHLLKTQKKIRVIRTKKDEKKKLKRK
ncbi:Ubiquitin carboxyl-terminal hydrolase family protein, partial [Reticulomyxa filosa]